MLKNYIFTVTTGRSGQATLYDILTKYSENCLPAFEEPNINFYFKGNLENIERLVRRKYFETNELLGRGKILDAFIKYDDEYIKLTAQKRLLMASKKAKINNSDTYFDISKFYARGLHIGFNNILSEFALVFLYRDPLLNMKSFLNRKKDFFLDNNMPDEERNVLTMSSKGWSKGEFYLWSWSEMYLRYKKILLSNKVKNFVIFNTADLLNPEKVSIFLDKLSITHSKILNIKKCNTNIGIGMKDTAIEKQDIVVLEDFLLKLPKNMRKKLFYLEDSLSFHTKNLGKKII